MGKSTGNAQQPSAAGKSAMCDDGPGENSTPRRCELPIQPRHAGLRLDDQRILGVGGVLVLVLLAGQSLLEGILGDPRLDMDSTAWHFEAGPPPRFAVDVNHADWPELSQLPRIGETLARRIVSTRDREGAFRTIEDLARVPGLGAATRERMLPYVSFSH